ncbi:MAG: DUF262 domain-containing HNH endonuclease family protein [Flavobacterium sp.]|nr:DUF262 domain-containing HNH endonuclease family protein [Flavobacterium sp.]
MEFRFTPEHKNINELFGRDIKYIIPEYQRTYSWDCIGKSDKNNQINVMWDDLIDYFNSEGKNTYFFGSMVFIGNGNQEYQVIDGQQRLTTMVLLFAAIKCFLNEVRPNVKQANLVEFITSTISFIDEVLYNKKLFGASTVEKKLKIEKNSGFNYDKVLTLAIECNTSASSVQLTSSTTEQKNVVSRYFNNVIFFKQKLGEEFLDKLILTESKAERLNEFIEFLKSRVSIVRILTPTFDVAYHIFEILNNRGLPLSNKDLFRNLIIKEWDTLKNSNPKKYEHIDPPTLWNELDDNYEFHDDFIGRWVESYKASKQQYSAFNDLKDIYDKIYIDIFPQKKIEIFYEDIKRDLGYYTTIVNNSFANPQIKAKINFILNASNYRYSMNFLLSLMKATRGLETDEFVQILMAFERYLVYCLLCVRFGYGPVSTAIEYLNKPDLLAAIKILEDNTDNDDIINALNQNYFENEIPKLLLAKIVWQQQIHTQDDVVSQVLEFNKATLEHIIPYTHWGTEWESHFDSKFLNNYKYKLGNMTLLTTRINSTIKNKFFDKKRLEYAKTKLPMTLELANLVTITEDYIEDRQERFVDIICKDLGIA